MLKTKYLLICLLALLSINCIADSYFDFTRIGVFNSEDSSEYERFEFPKSRLPFFILESPRVSSVIKKDRSIGWLLATLDADECFTNKVCFVRKYVAAFVYSEKETKNGSKVNLINSEVYNAALRNGLDGNVYFLSPSYISLNVHKKIYAILPNVLDVCGLVDNGEVFFKLYLIIDSVGKPKYTISIISSVGVYSAEIDYHNYYLVTVESCGKNL